MRVMRDAYSFYACVFTAMDKYMMLGYLYCSIAEPHRSSIQNRSRNYFFTAVLKKKIHVVKK